MKTLWLTVRTSRLTGLLIVCLFATIFAHPVAAGSKAAQIPVPKDTAILVALNVASHWNGPEKKALREISYAHPVVFTFPTKDMERLAGFPASQVKQLVIIGAAKDGEITVVTGTKPFAKNKVLRALARDAKEMTIAGRNVFVNEQNQAVWFASKTTIVLGNATRLTQFLKTPVEATAPLSTRLNKFNNKTILLLDGKVAPFRPLLQGGPPQVQPLMPLAKADTWRLTVGIAKGLRFQLRGTFDDPQKAKNAEPAARAALGFLGQYLTLATKMMPKMLAEQQQKFPGAKQLNTRLQKALQDAHTAVKDVTIRTKGNVLTASFTIETREPAATALLLSTLAPRGKKEDTK